MTGDAERQGLLFDPSAFDLPRPWVEDRCRFCLRPRTAAGHDPCIANLPKIANACCGHGVEDAYVVTDAGVAVYGVDAIDLMRKLGGDPP